ncbi:hypothetical protein DXG01_006492 [Tephrocybe rancida]|nr:hypothetical protein DXG01_006492 [Tephrocybe rancida]
MLCLKTQPPKERVIAYSDSLFHSVAIEWLIATDQPLSALEHPKFIEMIDVASQAPNGVKIPNCKATRQYIMDLFQKNIKNLRERFESAAVLGEVSMTCDAWQAGNADAYYAVTGRWIEEMSPGVWEKSALFGFTLMNTAHNGKHLDHTLFRIAHRLGITTKASWVTCDNASNNLTMLQHFEVWLNKCPKHLALKMKPWNWKDRFIRCLAHVINLATQAVISVYSPAKHFNTAKPEEHEPDTEGEGKHDEVGIIRTVVVKVRSSAKQKEIFKNLQVLNRDRVTSKQPLQLLIDMKM